jgi:CHAT domain-containing protein
MTTIPSAAFQQQRPERRRRNPSGGCLAVGYDGPAGGRLLRHTVTEAQFIAGLTGGRAWVGAEPKSADLPELAQDCRWLHVACHGRFLHDAPLDSYLETGLDDRLTAREVAQSWRLQAELVTLSACQTGVSRLLRGDEPLGLVRAFLAAGAEKVLVSQWAVADLPALLLMERFYQQLMSGQEAAAALHAAQVWLQAVIKEEVEERLVDLPGGEGEVVEGERPFADPRHWAAFILVGG